MAIKMPGIPNATWGPYHFNSHGVSAVEAVDPKLIAK
jgi:hypothetical protein